MSSSGVGINVIVKKWSIDKGFCLTCEVTTIGMVCDFGSSVDKNNHEETHMKTNIQVVKMKFV